MDELIDEANVESFLRRCADALPGDGKPESQMWGGSAAGQLFAAARETPLYDAAVRVLEAMLIAGSEDEARLAQNFAPPSIDTRALEAALTRALPPDVHRGVRAALGRALSADPTRYDPKYRALVGEPGWEASLGAMIVADHTWFAENAPHLLAGEPNVIELRLALMIPTLRESEVRAVREAFDRRRADFPAGIAETAITYLDAELTSTPFAPGPIRW